MKIVMKRFRIMLVCLVVQIGLIFCGCQSVENGQTRVNEESLFQTDSIQRNKNDDEVSSQKEIQTTEDVFLLDLSSFSKWESGDYSFEDGTKIENKRRVRCPSEFEITRNEYSISVSEDFCLLIFEYNHEHSFIDCLQLKNGEVYTPHGEARFFSLSLYRNYSEKSLSYGQWNSIFGELTVKLSNGDVEEMIAENRGPLISAQGEMTSGAELTDYLLNDSGEDFARALWNNYLYSGMYNLTFEDLEENNLTLFFSSSEGNDSNSGLSPRYPKRNPYNYSNCTNINILLRCGDTFEIPDSFCLGNNSKMVAYGDGDRPILDFYRDELLVFENVNGFENVWVADLSQHRICNGQTDSKSNCNIGQLEIDGKVNWERVTWPTSEELDVDALSNYEEIVWAADWHNSELYLVSNQNPNELTIRYAPAIHGIVIDGVKNVSVTGIEIKGAGCHGISIKNAENVNISCCYLNHIGGSILKTSSARYGNAIQLWDSGTDIRIEHNFVDWIFDTCYTHQGNAKDAVAQNVIFSKNIGSHAFWGLEIWGDGYSENEFVNESYSDNILYEMLDVTNPNTQMHVNTNGKLLADKNYRSYRTGYTYHQMSALNMSNSGKGSVEVKDNIFWNSNRFLMILSNYKEEKPQNVQGNFFFGEYDSEGSALYRYTFHDEKKQYVLNISTLLDESNYENVHICDKNIDDSQERKLLERKLEAISLENRLVINMEKNGED